MRNSGWKLAAIGAAVLAFSVAGMAQAYETAPDYDCYCYAKQSHKERDDALKGAAIGATLGAIFGKKKKKVKTAVIGAAVGAVAGYVVAKNSKEKIDCSDGRYYVYDKGYYDPAPADEGYKVVYFEERPADVGLFIRVNGQDQPYRSY